MLLHKVKDAVGSESLERRPDALPQIDDPPIARRPFFLKPPPGPARLGHREALRRSASHCAGLASEGSCTSSGSTLAHDAKLPRATLSHADTAESA